MMTLRTLLVIAASLPDITLVRSSNIAPGQHRNHENLVNQQELLQYKEQVASLKLSFHLKDRECRFFQSELASKESMVDTLQEQVELLSRECQRLELALQRTTSHEVRHILYQSVKHPTRSKTTYSKWRLFSGMLLDSGVILKVAERSGAFH